MKGLLLAGILTLGSFCGYTQTTAVEMNDKMVDITDKVFTYGEDWGKAFQVGMDKLDWSNLKPVRVKMQNFVNSAIQEVQAMPEVKGSKALQDVVVEFLNYENKVINEGFKPFEGFDGNEDDESLKKAIDRMVALGNGENDLLEKVMDVQEAYAKSNGFKVASEEVVEEAPAGSQNSKVKSKKIVLKYSWLILSLSLCIAACNSGGESVQNDRWKGNWERVESQDGAELEIKKINGDTLTFVLFATNGASFSQLEGTALIEDNRATFLADAEGNAAECEVVFELNNSSINISEGGSECGNAMYVWYAGEYRKGK